MDRVSSANYQTIGGRRTWRDKIVGVIAGTTFGALFMAGVQESIIAPVEHVGLTPTDSTLGSPDTQLLQAIQIIGAGNSGAVITSSTTLTPAQSGLVWVSAASGDVVLTLPHCNAANGQALRYTMVRTDNAAHTVTWAVQSGDSVARGAAGSIPVGGVITVHGDGGTAWAVTSSATNGLATWQAGLTASTSIGAAYDGALIDIGAAGTTQTLAAPGGAGVAGTKVSFVAAYTATIDIAGGASFYGAGLSAATSVTMQPGDFLSVRANGGNWEVLAASPGLLGFAPLNSPAFSGTVTVPTPPPGDNSTKAVNSAFVTAAIAAVFGTENDVTASRAANVTYTNSTPGPKFVSITVSSASSGSYANLVIGGVTVSTWTCQVNGVNFTGSVSGMVPENQTYGLSAGPAIVKWLEAGQ